MSDNTEYHWSGEEVFGVREGEFFVIAAGSGVGYSQLTDEETALAEYDGRVEGRSQLSGAGLDRLIKDLKEL